jgi:DNA-directed RNA polymerase specialized sigma24 family protein
MGRLLPLTEAAGMFSTSESTLYRLLRQKVISRYRKRGDRRTYVDEDELRTALGFERVDGDQG